MRVGKNELKRGVGTMKLIKRHESIKYINKYIQNAEKWKRKIANHNNNKTRIAWNVEISKQKNGR